MNSIIVQYKIDTIFMNPEIGNTNDPYQSIFQIK